MKLLQIKKMLILGSGIMLLGMVSCTTAVEVETDASMVPVAHISMQAQLGEGTKASYANRVISWEEGDQLLLYSNSQVNGIIVCTGVDGEGVGSFNGEVTNFNPTNVNAYFLGNRTVSSGAHSLTVDFSQQTGSASRLPNFILLKKTGLVFTADPLFPQSYAPAESVSMEPIVSILELRLNYTGTPGAEGYKAKRVRIKGLKNQITVNFADATVDVEGINDGITTVAPLTVGEYSTTYLMSVIPDAANTDITVQVAYQDDGVGSTYVMWTGINWSSMDIGKYYWTNWADKTLVQPSLKEGYNGEAVTGGENSDGTNHKPGYNGGDVEGSRDNPTGKKRGYGGQDVA